MDQDAIRSYVAETFASVDVVIASQAGGAPEVAWGDTFFLYNPGRRPETQDRLPFATIVTKDYGEFDRASDLNRPGVYRLNIGVSPRIYHSLFQERASAPRDAGAATAAYDFTVLDQLLPHPVYAAQSWVCVLNPSTHTFETAVRPLLAEAYDLAVRRYRRHAGGQ